MVVVLGATGHAASAVAETLLAHRRPVRVVVRSAGKGTLWKDKGADVAVATSEDTKAMIRALEGAQGVYLLVYRGFAQGAIGSEHPDSLVRGRVTQIEALRAEV